MIVASKSSIELLISLMGVSSIKSSMSYDITAVCAETCYITANSSSFIFNSLMEQLSKIFDSSFTIKSSAFEVA